jgi:hypothetical protein
MSLEKLASLPGVENVAPQFLTQRRSRLKGDKKM